MRESMGIYLMDLMPEFNWASDRQAETVRACRRYLGMTYAEFASALELAGDGARHVRRWEAGERGVKPTNQTKIEELVKEAYIEGAQSDFPRRYE